MPDILMLGLSYNQILTRFNEMKTDLEQNLRREATISEGLEYIRNSNWTLEEKIAVAIHLGASLGASLN